MTWLIDGIIVTVWNVLLFMFDNGGILAWVVLAGVLYGAYQFAAKLKPIPFFVMLALAGYSEFLAGDDARAPALVLATVLLFAQIFHGIVLTVRPVVDGMKKMDQPRKLHEHEGEWHEHEHQGAHFHIVPEGETRRADSPYVLVDRDGNPLSEPRRA